MKRWSWLIGFMLGAMLLVGCTRRVTVKVPTQSNASFIAQTHYHRHDVEQRELTTFVRKQLLTPKGLYTNYLTSANQRSQATGHEMLVESSGLWLTYLAQTKQSSAFRRSYKQTLATFDQGDQLSYRYDPATKKRATVNATLDDLRVIRALEIYAAQTHSQAYAKKAATRFALLKKHNLAKGRLVDFYDVHAHQASTTSSLAYYDLLTLRYFESVSKTQRHYYQKQLELVQAGYLGNAFPLYAASYDWQSGEYSSQHLNTSEALEVLLHLAEVGKLRQQSLDWLIQQVRAHKLYNSYTIDGIVVNKNQAAANYALAALIFATVHDREMYQTAMRAVWTSQVVTRRSPIYGALGDATTNQTYSFNDLTALVATTY